MFIPVEKSRKYIYLNTIKLKVSVSLHLFESYIDNSKIKVPILLKLQRTHSVKIPSHIQNLHN